MTAATLGEAAELLDNMIKQYEGVIATYSEKIRSLQSEADQYNGALRQTQVLLDDLRARRDGRQNANTDDERCKVSLEELKELKGKLQAEDAAAQPTANAVSS